MQRSLAALIALILLFSTVGWSADFKKGFKTYQRKDYATALREFKPLAEQGDAEAQYNLGFMYANGEGVPKNDKMAVKWWKLAAEQGHASAQYNLGFMYGEGKAVPQNMVYAHMWLNVAASQGHEIAAEGRDLASKTMTLSQIEKAQDLASECVEKKKLKGCD